LPPFVIDFQGQHHVLLLSTALNVNDQTGLPLIFPQVSWQDRVLNNSTSVSVQQQVGISGADLPEADPATGL